MTRLLVTGAAGFLGRTIARHFAQNGWYVCGVDRIPTGEASLQDLNEYAQLNLPDSRFDEILLSCQPQVCIHAAGGASVPAAMKDPRSDFMNGPALTFALLDSLREHTPEALFVNISSAAVYGNPASLPVQEQAPIRPISAYGFHKWQSEVACREYAELWRMKTVSVRVFSAYGPGLRRQVIWDIIYKALTNTEVLLQGTGRESRDFIHAEDIARGIGSILSNAPMLGEAYNLASGSEISIGDLATTILGELKSACPVKFTGGLPAGTPLNWRADISEISRLGFSPEISLEDGLASSVVWATREILGVK